MNNIILIPTDFSAVCSAAVHYGAQMAQKINASIAIIHIINEESVSNLPSQDNVEDQIREKLDEISNEIKVKHDIIVETIYRKGDIFTSITEISVEISAKLIILGTHGKVGVQQKLTGSFAHKVVLSSNVPVIILPKGALFNEGIRKIVFPLSTSDQISEKVSWLIQIAKTFDSKIFLFNDYENIEEDRIDQNDVINQISKEFITNSVQYELHNADKGVDFNNQLLFFSKKIESDMILIMSNRNKLNFMYAMFDEQIMFNENNLPTMMINPKDKISFN